MKKIFFYAVSSAIVLASFCTTKAGMVTIPRQDTEEDIPVTKILGEGFFQISAPNDGIYYVTCAQFRLNNEHQLVTINGYQVLPVIEAPEKTTDITIDEQGIAYAITPESINPQRFGQLELAFFPNPKALTRAPLSYDDIEILMCLCHDFYRKNAKSGEPIIRVLPSTGRDSSITQYYPKPIAPVTAITELIDVQRRYKHEEENFCPWPSLLSPP